MGGLRPAFAPGPAPALGDSSLCRSAPLPTITFPAPASSPLCSAMLGSRSSCCLRGSSSQGSGSEPGVLSPWQAETGPWGVSWVVSGQQAFPTSSSFPVGLTPPCARSPGPCSGPHRQAGGALTLPLGRWMGCPPHRPHPVRSSAMTVTVSQACLEFSELGLASMAAASAHSTFCSQNEQRRVSGQITPRRKKTPLGA